MSNLLVLVNTRTGRVLEVEPTEDFAAARHEAMVRNAKRPLPALVWQVRELGPVAEDVRGQLVAALEAALHHKM